MRILRGTMKTSTSSKTKGQALVETAFSIMIFVTTSTLFFMVGMFGWDAYSLKQASVNAVRAGARVDSNLNTAGGAVTDFDPNNPRDAAQIWIWEPTSAYSAASYNYRSLRDAYYEANRAYQLTTTRNRVGAPLIEACYYSRSNVRLGCIRGGNLVNVNRTGVPYKMTVRIQASYNWPVRILPWTTGAFNVDVSSSAILLNYRSAVCPLGSARNARCNQ